MTARDRDLYTTRKTLQDAGWNVQKPDSIKFNHGSETLAHAHAKLVAGWYLKQHGYRINSEVENPGGEVDVLAYSEEDIIIVECETDPDRDVVQDKLERYVTGEPPRDMFLVNVSEMPGDCVDALGYLEDIIGL